jgi:hypothetical protein
MKTAKIEWPRPLAIGQLTSQSLMHPLPPKQSDQRQV